MKILSLEPREADFVYMLRIKPDTVLLRNNSPLFIPDFAEEIFCRFDIAMKIDKLGKCISRRYASRYFSQVFPVVEFYAHGLKGSFASIMEGNLFSCFDNSFALSTAPILVENNNLIQTISSINGISVESLEVSDVLQRCSEIIEYASEITTLKIGDLVSLGLSSKKIKVNIGDNIKCLSPADNVYLDFCIK
ncbi:MAG: fumarylacetoacetate hydrolase family protein [Bacteroidales bacterium]